MYNKILLIGLGKSFYGVIHYLHQFGFDNITVSDKEIAKEKYSLDYVNKNYPNIKIDNKIKFYSYSLVLLAISGKDTEDFLYNSDNFCLFKDKKVFISLGRPNYDNKHDFSKLDLYVQAHNASLFLGFGLEPGITEAMIYHEIMKNKNSSKIRCFSGCIPKFPSPPLNYNILFGDKIPYHDRIALYKKNDQILSTTRYATKEDIYVTSIGVLESYHDGLSPYLLKTNIASEVPNIEQKTVRYPGFYRNIKPLLDMNMFSDTKIDELNLSCNDLLHKILFKNKILSHDINDISFIYLVCENENYKKYTLVLSTYDDISKISGAMKLTTFFFTYSAFLLLNKIISVDIRKGILLSFEAYEDQKVYEIFKSKFISLGIGTYCEGDIDKCN